nr:MAG TPA: tail protein [Caudoviricetes sp.]
MNTNIISNPVYQSIQVGEGYESTTGTILYANKYSGVSPVDMPDDIKSILDSNLGSVGTNPIIQLKNKLAALPNGPWYIDCRNGILYIHNKKFKEDSVHSYVYQSENGEVLSLTFETQRRTKSLGHSTGGGIDPFSKDIVGVNSNVKSSTPGPGAKKEEYKPLASRVKVIAAIDKTRVNDTQVTNRIQVEAIAKQRTKALQKKKANQKVTTDKAYKNYKNGYTVNRQFTDQLKGSSNARKDKWAQKLYSKLSANNRVDLSSYVAEEWKKTHNRSAVLKLVREYFGYGKHTIFAKVWKEQWVDPTTYTGNNTFRGTPKPWTAFNGGYSDRKEVRESVGRMGRDPQIKVLSNVDILKDSQYGGHYRIKVFRLANVKGVVESAQIVTDWLIRLSNPGYSSTGRITTRGGTGGFGGSYIPSLTGNTGRTVTEKKLVVTMRVIGRPSLESSQIIHIGNVGEKWSGDYYIKTCSHDMSPDMGYTCTLELTKNGEKAEIESGTTKLSTGKVVKDLSSTSDSQHNSSRGYKGSSSSNQEDKSYKREYYSTSKTTISRPKSKYQTKKARDK